MLYIKSTPRHDAVSCMALKVDKYMVDFQEKRLPKNVELDLNIMHPLTSAWQNLADRGLKDDP